MRCLHEVVYDMTPMSGSIGFSDFLGPHPAREGTVLATMNELVLPGASSRRMEDLLQEQIFGIDVFSSANSTSSAVTGSCTTSRILLRVSVLSSR
jgi:glutamine amidotransferase PdxT